MAKEVQVFKYTCGEHEVQIKVSRFQGRRATAAIVRGTAPAVIPGCYGIDAAQCLASTLIASGYKPSLEVA